ncbi:MAG: cupin domain-containing protein [Abditibacteriaceae bacterium]
MPPEMHNLFALDPSSQTTERFNILLQTPYLRLEQIVSCGMASAEGFWYDQDKTEWVLLAKGEAVLEFEKEKLITLQAGDYLEIPAHQKHRVASCSQDAIWLTLHF